MRACFLGQNVTALGYGVAILHSPRLPDPESLLGEKPIAPEGLATPLPDEQLPQAPETP